MLDMVATNDIIYTQRNKITGVAGFTVTLSTNHLSTDGALAQVKINGAFVRNTFGDVTLAANTRGVTTTISDMLIISVASASKTDSNNDLTVRNSIQIDNSSIEGDNILALAGNSKVSIRFPRAICWPTTTSRSRWWAWRRSRWSTAAPRRARSTPS